MGRSPFRNVVFQRSTLTRRTAGTAVAWATGTHYIDGALIYTIRVGPDAKEELRAYDRRRIVEAVTRELREKATVDTKPRRRLLPDPDSGIGTTGPIWQLRVGDFRVFYDVDERSRVVMIQRIARKGRLWTKEVL